MRRDSLSYGLLRWILPIGIGAVAVVSGITYGAARSVLLSNLESSINVINDVAATQASAYFRQRQSELKTLCEISRFRDHYMTVEYDLKAEANIHRDEIKLLLKRFSDRTQVYLRLRYQDPSGNRIVEILNEDQYSPVLSQRDVKMQPAPPSLEKGEVHISKILNESGILNSFVRYSTPFIDDSGEFRGALILDASLSPIHAILKKMSTEGRSSILIRNTTKKSDGARAQRTKDSILIETPILGTPWSIATTNDHQELLRPLRIVGRAALATVIISTLIMIVLVTRQVKELLDPLTSLANSVREFGKGKLSLQAEETGSPEIASLASTFNQMASGLKKMNDDLRNSEARYRNAIEQSPYAIVSLNREFEINLWNAKSTELFGYSDQEAQGHSLDIILETKALEEFIRQASEYGTVDQIQTKGHTHEGKVLDISISLSAQKDDAGTPYGWLAILIDETEQRRLQSRLMQAEKMNAIGNLLAGVAHELNNPLAAVIGFADLVNHLPSNSEEKEDLNHLYASALRCRDIVQGLLQFARQEKTALKRVSLNKAVQKTLALLEYRIAKSEGIRLETNFDPSEPEIAADFQKIQQVLVNLITNAIDALNSHLGERLIAITTKKTQNACQLIVYDSGPGVSSEKLATLFDPFVTTKLAGKGTGLGLSISKQIVEEASGTLILDESVTQGTGFLAAFPPCPEDLPSSEMEGELPPPSPGKNVLVVDDEARVAKLMVRFLSEDGLDAVAAHTPKSALGMLENDSFDLIITDVDMGKVKGTEIFRAARKAQPNTVVIFVTGNILNPSLSQELTEYDAPVITKPFLRTDFLRVVRFTLREAAFKKLEEPAIKQTS
ncbi:MAG: hypothetical protein COB53_02990 [Elusimicrobia bacterium]|nr:MAG: hypothetical protein COB53_02990 [Elusimicrobiota bacterium]